MHHQCLGNQPFKCLFFVLSLLRYNANCHQGNNYDEKKIKLKQIAALYVYESFIIFAHQPQGSKIKKHEKNHPHHITDCNRYCNA